MLLLPIRGQYEQVVNACYAEKLGLGLHRSRLDADTLAEYLAWSESPVAEHADLLWPENEGFFQILDGTIRNVSRPFAHNAEQPRRLALG